MQKGEATGERKTQAEARGGRADAALKDMLPKLHERRIVIVRGKGSRTRGCKTFEGTGGNRMGFGYRPADGDAEAGRNTSKDSHAEGVAI
jgi:hypothetical protein